MSRDDDAERGRAEPIDVDFEPAERGYHHAPGGIGGGTALLLAVLAAGVGAAGGAVAPRVAPVRTALDSAFPVSASASTPGSSAQSEGALTQRVAALEGIVNAPLHDSSGTPISPGGDTAARVFALQSGLRDVETQLSRIPSSEQVAQLVTEVRGLQEQLPAVAEQARTASNAARAAFAVAAASDASSHSGPFQESYASLQALLPQDANVLALEPLSRTGAPTRAELRDRFSHLDIEIVRASQQAQAGSGFWGRIQAMLAQWIVVRRSGEGDTPAGVVDRADQRVAADDLDGAVRELSRLSGASRATAQPWINDAQRRIEIDRRLAAIRSTLARGA
ncbi:MAG: mitofilin family membrane protein [Vitreimonas sp.]